MRNIVGLCVAIAACQTSERSTAPELEVRPSLAAVRTGRSAVEDEPSTHAMPLLSERTLTALAGELSGTNAKHIVQELSLHHRQRGSLAFLAAAESIRDRAERHGLQDVEILALPADGEIFYGAQRSRPAWDATFAELWELREVAGEWTPAVRIGSWETQPATLAEDSESGEANAELVDVGPGTDPKHYEGKHVAGKLVLVSSQPADVRKLAIEKHGAAGIVSWARNANTAWRDENTRAVRWGHLGTFPRPTTFAFMVSSSQADAWKRRIERGDVVRLKASVRAGQRPGAYHIVTAVIPGSDPELRHQDIVFSCHLDHERPGANDNASGCATTLEIARTISKLVHEGRIPAPKRTIRFVWPPEIEGTHAFLNAKPEITRRIVAAVHLDMVGGGAETKAMFHVVSAPKSLPTFVTDVGRAFLAFVNAQSLAYATSGSAELPLISPEGSRDPLRGRVVDLTLGSDHTVYTDGSFRIPTLYLNDWPDVFIHTTADSIDKIDETKLLRAAFIAAASGYFLAQFGEEDVGRMWLFMQEHMVTRAAVAVGRLNQLTSRPELASREPSNFLRFHVDYERRALASMAGFANVPSHVAQRADQFVVSVAAMLGASVVPEPEPYEGIDATRVYRRNPEPTGPVTVTFDRDYLEDRLQALELAAPELRSFAGLWGTGESYVFEALNLVDGKRTVQQVRDDLAAIYGPVPVSMVARYLETLETIGVLDD